MNEDDTAFEHLQRAAAEMIAAARAALDTLEAVVADPPRPEVLLAHVMKLMGRGGPEPPGPSTKPVEHIPVK